MAYIGNAGIVKVGAGFTAVAEITSFSIEETSDTVECTAMGDTYRTYKSTFKDWTASVDVNWDPDDTGQQSVLVAGAEMLFSFYPEGDTTGDFEMAGTGIVTSVSRSAELEGLVTASISVQGTGALQVATVT